MSEVIMYSERLTSQTNGRSIGDGNSWNDYRE